MLIGAKHTLGLKKNREKRLRRSHCCPHGDVMGRPARFSGSGVRWGPQKIFRDPSGSLLCGDGVLFCAWGWRLGRKKPPQKPWR